MSELKALWIPTRSGNSCHCYLKSEVDKVIAEKDKEIEKLEKSLEQKNIAEGSVRRILWNLVDSGIIKEWYFNGEYNVLLSADDPHIQIAELRTKIDKVSLKFCKQLCHNKFKRCLAMAKLAVEDDYAPWNMKWHKRWLELAEKFKEA